MPVQLRRFPRGTRPAVGLVLLLFTFSGSSALIYELLWARRLHLVLGSSTEAVTAVLAAYMAGLALGSALLGRLAERSRRPLALYGKLEIAIGLSALALPWAMNLLDAIYASHYERLSASPALLHGTRFLSSFVLLLVPTALMGGTLPALARELVRDRGDSTRMLGWLYALNTLGAAAGAFLVGFTLIYAWGITRTTWVAAGINISAGLVALAMARGGSLAFDTNVADTVGGAEVGSLVAPSRIDGAVRLALLVGGVAALAYEVAWTRALVLVVGSTTQGFATILITFLLGIGLGSLLTPRLSRGLSRERLAALLFGVHIAIGVSSLALSQLYDRLPTLVLAGMRASPQAWAAAPLVFLTGGLVLLVPTLGMGIAFPLGAGLLSSRAVGREVGGAYALTTVGNILGALGAGIVLVPLIGTQRTLEVAGALSLAAGIAGLALARLVPLRPLVLAAILALVAIPVLPHWNRFLMGAGVWYYPDYYQKGAGLLPQALRWRLTYFKEGRDMLVTVNHDETNVTLAVNGKVDASTGDAGTQFLLGYLPGLLHPAPKRALIVGFGSGATAGAILRVPGVEAVTTVEIEPAVLGAAPQFESLNHGALGDRRHHLVLDDARAFYAGTSQRFDIIISEPSNPLATGVSNLFTGEAFRLARGALAPGGLMCQWVQGYRISPDTIAMIVRSFAEVFPAVTIWSFDGDFFLVGSERPLGVDAGRIDAAIARSPEMAQDLRQQLGITRAAGLLAYFAAGPQAARAFAAGALVHSDDRPLLEAVIRRPYRGDSSNLAFVRSFEPRPRLAGLGHEADPDETLAFARALITAHLRDDATEAGLSVLARNPDAANAANAADIAEAEAVVADAAREAGSASRALEHYVRALEKDPTHPGAVFGMAKLMADRGRRDQALEALARARPSPLLDREIGRLRAELLEQLGRPGEAAQEWQRLLGDPEERYLAEEALGRLTLAQGDPAAARRHLVKALEENPDDGRAKGILAAVLASQGETAKAIVFSREAVRAAPEDVPTRLRLIALLLAAHQPGAVADVADVAEEGLAYNPGNLDLLRAMRSVGRRVF
ncbi:MAG: spermidine synthase [Acidobacteriota bacterium]|jgi:spermidine synthase|nr:spermidine synthase [Acidobacteriota bacterium]